MVVLLRALLIGAIVSTVGCVNTTTDFCRFDSECEESGTPFCVNGICSADECAANSDCDSEEACVEGVCMDQP
ncbi:MAG: hypothetical protein KC561_03180 [Myxococcales bacterium]|nr:hypothetical protein [Myxococcales bacterium]